MQHPGPPIQARSKDTTFTHQVRHWGGALVVMTDVRVNGPLSMSVCVPDRAQVSVMLQQVGGVCEPRHHSGRPRTSKINAHEINFAPAGVRVWGESERIQTFRTISLLFDPGLFVNEVCGDAKFQLPDEPWLGLPCEPIARLARLLSKEFESEDELSALSAESLIVAIVVQLRRRFDDQARTMTQDTTGLSHAELKRVLSYIDDNISVPIRLQDLVRLTGMSQSAFCAAFKRSTGVPPHRYHLSARIRRAQAHMLTQPDHGLAEVARQFGFADHAHFGRVFRSVVGETPRAWLMSRRRGRAAPDE